MDKFHVWSERARERARVSQSKPEKGRERARVSQSKEARQKILCGFFPLRGRGGSPHSAEGFRAE